MGGLLFMVNIDPQPTSTNFPLSQLQFLSKILSPFLILLAAGFNGHEEATALLLYFGANFQALNKTGVSARAETRSKACHPYTVLENGSYDELLKTYPVLANIPRTTSATGLS